MRAATELTATVGLSEWSLRTLASELDVTPAAIYWHVEDRSALEALVVDGLLSNIHLPDESHLPTDALKSLAFATFEILAAYPGTARHMATFGPSMSGALAIANNSIGHLQRAGLNTRQAAETHSITTSLVLAIADSAGARRLLEADVTEPVAFRETFEELDNDLYPHLAKASDVYQDVAGRRPQLEVGLALLFAGAGISDASKQ